VLAVALPAWLAGCDQPSPSQANPQKAEAAPPGVAVSRPAQREIVEWDEYTGRFDSVETVEVRARVSGYLAETHFKDGQLVKQGDLLYVIDQRPFERARDLAQAELLAATTKAANANLDVERGKPLVERRVMSEKSFDEWPRPRSRRPSSNSPSRASARRWPGASAALTSATATG
jgi:multidrug efflux pump subunit AcrA (membrane-fusion protein)